MSKIQIPREYQPLFNTDWREAAIWGGRNSLKSHTIARYLLIEARRQKTRILCAREFQNSIADSSHQLLHDLITLYGLTDFVVTNNAIINTVTGSDFLFKGLKNNVQSVKSTEGIDIAWVEEAQTVSAASIDVLTPTVRKKGSRIIYTYNRLRVDDPIHQRLVIEGRPNTLLINVNYDVAIKYGWMGEALMNEMEDDKKHRPEIYRHKWLGEPVTLRGLIYPDWKQIDEVPQEAEYLGAGLDFGYTNDPTALIDVYKWNDSYILDESLYQRGLKNSEIGLVCNKKGIPLVVADSSEPKSIDEIADCDVAIIPAVKGKDSVNSGIQSLQGKTIYYTARSHNIEEEQLNYAWKVNKEDRSLNVPIDAYNHALDAARYFISHKESYKMVDYSGGVV